MMLQDILASLKNWRLIHLLGVSNLRSRYSRSKLGQAWLTVSLFIQIAASGLVWSMLWHIPIKDFLPYVAVGQTVYQFFFLTISDSTGLFVADSRLYINQRLPFVTSVFSSLYKNLIIFIHNVPIIVLALIFSGQPIHGSWTIFPVILLALAFLMSFSYFIACLCTRYRDIVQIITSLLNISFLLTPVIWKLSYVPEHLQGYFFINPLACFLEIIRNPWLGMQVNPLAYVSSIGWTMFSILMLLYMSRRFEKRIILWI